MNLANKLTLTRIILVPIMIALYIVGMLNTYAWALWAATGVYIIAAITDFFDGRVARKRNMVTTFGKFIDPIADKILVTAAFLLVMNNGSIPVPYGVIGVIIILFREFIIAGLRQCGANSGKAIAADMFGKVKTFVQDITASVLMMMPIIAFWWIGFLYLGYALFGASVILTILSGINYLIVNKDVIGLDDK